MDKQEFMAYRKPLFRLKLKKNTIYGLFSVALGLGSVLIAVAVLFPQGTILTKINLLVSRYVGWTGFILALVLLWSSLLFSRLKLKMTQFPVVFGMFLTWVSVLGLTKAGMVGAEIWNFLEVAFSIGFLIVVILLAVG